MKTFKGRDIIAIKDFNKEEILYVLSKIAQVKEKQPKNLLDSFLLGTCFYEPSTRTRLSFEAAMHRLGGRVIGFSTPSQTSSAKGEALYDTMKMLEGYVDVVALRHPLEGAAKHAADAINIPVINAGDGANQHPTQTFLDLFSIQETQGHLDDLHLAVVGDLKYGRTVHSLIDALQHFNTRLYFLSPPQLELPEEMCQMLRLKGIKFSFHHTLEDILPRLDIIYMTRMQQERFNHKEEFEQIQYPWVLYEKHLKHAKKSMRILHPLPRQNEIDPSVDHSLHAYYFKQAENGLYARQAILGLILGKIS